MAHAAERKAVGFQIRGPCLMPFEVSRSLFASFPDFNLANVLFEFLGKHGGVVGTQRSACQMQSLSKALLSTLRDSCPPFVTELLGQAAGVSKPGLHRREAEGGRVLFCVRW